MSEDIERIAKLEAKMDVLLEAVNRMEQSLSTNYVPRHEIETRFKSQEQRLERLENGPTKWIPIAISFVCAGVAIISILTK